MAEHLIHTQLSHPQVRFQPGGDPVRFALTVTNQSDRFAGFQLTLIPAGTSERRVNPQWYCLVSEVSSQTPPGDTMTFVVEVFDSPVLGFVGLMNITLVVSAIELPGQEDRQILRLQLDQGSIPVPLEVKLPVRKFQSQPQEPFDLPVVLENPGPVVINAQVTLEGIDEAWVIDGVERRLVVPGEGKAELLFHCNPPFGATAPSQIYPFAVVVHQSNGAISRGEGTVEVLPKGRLDLRCGKRRQAFPRQGGWWLAWKGSPAIYELAFVNQSNLSQTVGLTLEEADRLKTRITPEELAIAPEETGILKIQAKGRRPWLGRGRRFTFQAKGLTSDSTLPLENKVQNLELCLHPFFPLWLQAVGAIALVYLVWWFSWLNPSNPRFGHQGPVTAVQLNGMVNEAISGASDRTAIRWNLAGFTYPWVNQYLGHIVRADEGDKAIRVVRYQPKNNDVIAVGRENGQIQLWDLRQPRSPAIAQMGDNLADRVFDLRFSPDSQYLFSGHGSGQLLTWFVGSNPYQSPQLTRTTQLGFAISGMAIAAADRSTPQVFTDRPAGDLAPHHLAIAGRFNQMRLWNWQDQSIIPIAYPQEGGREDYITSLVTADYRPFLAATADTQGTMVLWNLNGCFAQTSGQTCTNASLEQWSGHGGQVVRSVSLSANGCYLASGGDDGRVVLWPLTPDGRRVISTAYRNGIELYHPSWFDRFQNRWLGKQISFRINTVDVQIVGKDVVVVSGGDQHQVRLFRQPRSPLQQLGCDLPNPKE